MNEINKYFIDKQFYAKNYPDVYKKIQEINYLTSQPQFTEEGQTAEQDLQKQKKKKKQAIQELIHSEEATTIETSYSNECQEDEVRVFEKKLEQINFESRKTEKIKPSYSKQWIKKLKANAKKMRNQLGF